MKDTCTAYLMYHNSGVQPCPQQRKSVFEYVEAHPDKAKRFAGARSSLTSHKCHGPEFMIRGYPWASLGHKTVVELGGSEGKYRITLAQSFPQLNFIAQDLPAVFRAVNSKRPDLLGLENLVTSWNMTCSQLMSTCPALDFMMAQ